MSDELEERVERLKRELAEAEKVVLAKRGQSYVGKFYAKANGNVEHWHFIESIQKNSYYAEGGLNTIEITVVDGDIQSIEHSDVSIPSLDKLRELNRFELEKIKEYVAHETAIEVLRKEIPKRLGEDSW